MKNPKQTESTETGSPGDSNPKSSCCNFENMAQMMKKFCGGRDGGFDCCAMMEKMCGKDQEKSDQQ